MFRDSTAKEKVGKTVTMQLGSNAKAPRSKDAMPQPKEDEELDRIANCRLPIRGRQPVLRERYWAAIFGPGLAIHFDAELPVATEGDTRTLNLEILILRIIFDRNPNVRFHQCMVATGLQKSPVHDLVHSQLFNNS